MSITTPSFSSRSPQTDPRVIIPLLPLRPVPLQALAASVTPNQIVGYYDTAKQAVELFVASPEGTYYIKVAG